MFRPLSLFRRRPSASMFVALLALFVALGGPAQAARLFSGKQLRKGSVTSKQIRNHTLQVRDLRRRAARSLRRTPNGSITEAKIRNGAVTPGKLARGAVGSAAIADRSVGSGDIARGAVGGFEVADASLTGTDVADGTLDARDIGRYWGHFSVPVSSIEPGKCWRKDPLTLAPERSNADIRNDVILVTPSAGWPEPPGIDDDEGLTFNARASVTPPSHFTLTICNETAEWTPARTVSFNYVVIDVP